MSFKNEKKNRFFFFDGHKIFLALEDKENTYGATTGSPCHTPLGASVP